MLAEAGQVIIGPVYVRVTLKQAEYEGQLETGIDTVKQKHTFIQYKGCTVKDDLDDLIMVTSLQLSG